MTKSKTKPKLPAASLFVRGVEAVNVYEKFKAIADFRGMTRKAATVFAMQLFINHPAHSFIRTGRPRK